MSGAHITLKLYLHNERQTDILLTRHLTNKQKELKYYVHTCTCKINVLFASVITFYSKLEFLSHLHVQILPQQQLCSCMTYQQESFHRRKLVAGAQCTASLNIIIVITFCQLIRPEGTAGLLLSQNSLEFWLLIALIIII